MRQYQQEHVMGNTKHTSTWRQSVHTCNSIGCGSEVAHLYDDVNPGCALVPDPIGNFDAMHGGNRLLLGANACLQGLLVIH